MNASDYTFLLSHPDAVNERKTDALEKIVTEFPYFQSARALRLKGLYNQNSFQYNYALKVTAAHTTDRSVLFDFITSDSFTAIQKGLYDQKVAEIEGINVTDSHVVSNQEVSQERAQPVDLAEQSIRTSIREAESRNEPAEPAFIPVEEKPIEEINAEDFGPVDEEPQFLPEAIAPVEFKHLEQIEFVPLEQEIPQESTPEFPHIETSKEETFNISNDQTDIETREPVEELTDTEEIENRLDIGKPFVFSKDETHSFQEWLQLSRLQPIDREIHTEVKADEMASELPLKPEIETSAKEKPSKDALIDRFIEANPKMPKVKPEIKPVAIEPKEDTSALMTETLARVYLEQRKYQKAIQAYEILILKYPEKSSFFADRISEIKNLQQNNIL